MTGNGALIQSISRVAFFLLLPFLMLFGYLGVPGWFTLGEDYPAYGIHDQLTLVFSLSKRSFPLFVPGYYGGQSSAAQMMTGEIYHPLAWLATVLPGYWSGQALLIHTLLRFLSLGIAQFILYKLFRKLHVPVLWAFICSFIATYNLIMLECFRYGQALESYTGFIFTCASMGYVWLEPQRRRHLFFLVVSAYWLVCSGHPQFAYYGLLGALLFAGFFPFVCGAMQGQPSPLRAVFRYYVACIACLMLAGALSAALLIPYYFDFMRTNCGRVNQGYDYSASWTDSVIGEFSSFFFPFRSNVPGNFGGTGLIAVGLFIPLAMLFEAPARILLGTLWSAGAIIFLFTLGRATPVHHLMWQIMPFSHSLRCPGRLAMILPMLIAWMLAVWQHCPTGPAGEVAQRRRRFWFLMGITAFYAAFTCHYIFTEGYAIAAPLAIRPEISSSLQIGTQLLGVLGLVLLGCWSRWPSRTVLGVLVCGCVVAQTGMHLYYGTYRIPSPPMPTMADMEARARESLRFNIAESDSFGTQEVCSYQQELKKRQARGPALEPYKNPPLAAVHTRVEFIPNRETFFRKFDSGALKYPTLTVEKMPEESFAHAKDGAASVKLLYSSYNRMVFEARTINSAYVSINYPFAHNWQAWLDQKQVPVYRADGLYLAVALPPGSHILEIRYWSNAQYAGMIISCLALLVFWIIISCNGLQGTRRYTACFVGIFMVSGLFWLWQHSLYNGSNLQTHYVWENGVS